MCCNGWCGNFPVVEGIFIQSQPEDRNTTRATAFQNDRFNRICWHFRIVEQKGHRAHRNDPAHTGREHRAGAAATRQSSRKHFRWTNYGLDGECGYDSGQVLEMQHLKTNLWVCVFCEFVFVPLVDCVAAILLLEPWTCFDSGVPRVLVTDWCSRRWSTMPFRPGIWVKTWLLWYWHPTAQKWHLYIKLSTQCGGGCSCGSV